MMSEHFSKCPKGLSQNLTIGLNLKFPAETLYRWFAMTLCCKLWWGNERKMADRLTHIHTCGGLNGWVCTQVAQYLTKNVTACSLLDAIGLWGAYTRTDSRLERGNSDDQRAASLQPARAPDTRESYIQGTVEIGCCSCKLTVMFWQLLDILTSIRDECLKTSYWIYVCQNCLAYTIWNFKNRCFCSCLLFICS
jgi:hypothetical protein